MTVNEVNRHIKFDGIFDLKKDFERHLENYKKIPCKIIIQNNPGSDDKDPCPMVHGNKLLFFDENEIKRPHKH